MQRALIGGREPVPTLAELFDAFPDARFNIDLKSEGAVEALAGFVEEREAWDRVLVGLVLRPPAATRSGGCTGGRVATSAHPLEVVAFRPLAQRPARPAGSPAAGRSRCRSRTGAGR